MAVKFLEPGGDADFGIGLWPAVDGTPSPTASSSVVHGSHLRSITYDHTNSDTSCVRATGVAAAAGGRVSTYFNFAHLPGGLDSIILLDQSGLASPLITVRVTGGGIVTLQIGGGAQVGSNGPTLSINTWYRISFCWTITSSTVNQFRVYVNGTLAVTASNVTLGRGTAAADIRVGNGSGDLSAVMYTSDHYIDNDTSLSDTGDIWVTAKRPNANGTSVQFTTQIGAGGSGYGSGHSPQVNERANSDTNGWSISTTTKQTEEYNIEGKSVGDIDISAATIIDYMGWIRASEASTSNSPVTHIIVNGVATAKTLTTAAAYYTQIAGSATYPAATGTDIGMDGQYTTTAHLFSLFECGVVVAYTPGSALTNTQTAIARIANNLTKTQPAIARLAVNVTKTQSALGRIAVKLTTTQSAIARISNTITKTQPAVSRIANIVTKTQTAKAAIVGIVAKTQSAVARIANSKTKTQPAIARVANNVTKTQPSTARIQETVTKTQGAVARIADNLTRTQNAIARIGQTGTKTQPAIARLANVHTSTQGAISRISVNLAKTQPAVARVAVKLTKTQSATANITTTSVSTKTQTAVARIANTLTKTQSAGARIQQPIAKTQTAIARIAKSFTKTQSATARVAAGVTKTQSSTASIAVRVSMTQPATARIATGKALQGGNGAVPAIWVRGDDPTSQSEIAGSSIPAVTWVPGNRV